MPITEKETTVTLNGVTSVEFNRRYPYFAVRNDSSDTIYVSTTKTDCSKDADGVISIPSGGSYVAFNGNTDNRFLYLNGSGKAAVVAQYDKMNPFKAAQGGGDSGGIACAKTITMNSCYDLDIAATGILIEEE